MADHNKPTVTTGYLDFVSQMHDKMNDISRGLDPARTSPTNMPQYAVRWSSASKKWQIWNGASWVDLASEYAINISGAAAKLKTKRKISIGGGATAAGVDFDGTSNIELNLTDIDYTKVSGLGSASTKTIGSDNGDVLEVGGGAGQSRTNSQNDSRFARLSGGDDANFTIAPKINGVSLGTAATRNVGTGNGNVMEVGAFGFGGGGSTVKGNLDAAATLALFRSGVSQIWRSEVSNAYVNAYSANLQLNTGDTFGAISIGYSSSSKKVIVSGGNNTIAWSAEIYHTGNPPPTPSLTWGNISGKPATATRWPSWGEVTGKPGIPPYNQSIGAGGVGQLALVSTPTTTTTWGSTISGSSLQPAGTTVVGSTASISRAAAFLSGTWRILGATSNTNGQNNATLAIRVS